MRNHLLLSLLLSLFIFLLLLPPLLFCVIELRGRSRGHLRQSPSLGPVKWCARLQVMRSGEIKKKKKHRQRPNKLWNLKCVPSLTERLKEREGERGTESKSAWRPAANVCQGVNPGTGSRKEPEHQMMTAL